MSTFKILSAKNVLFNRTFSLAGPFTFDLIHVHQRTGLRLFRRKLTRSLNRFINHTKRASKPVDVENEKKKTSKSASFKRILSQVEPVKYRLGGALVLSTFSSGIMMTIPYFTGWVIDHAVAGTIPIEQITTAGAILFGVQFGSNFFRSGSTDKSNQYQYSLIKDNGFIITTQYISCKKTTGPFKFS